MVRGTIFCLAVALVSPVASAALSIFATVPEWGALVEELGGDKVKVYTATNALQDPHHVEAKPSLIARARGADLVVATGAELEIDRKSTRLNSSHLGISYAVFCLKKKKV